MCKFVALDKHVAKEYLHYIFVALLRWMKMFTRNETRRIEIGGKHTKKVAIGGGAEISVQTMAKCPTTEVAKVLAQLRAAEFAGCDIFRVTVPDFESAEALKQITAESSLPIVADIHFDWRLALAALDAGVHKLRINPGNIGDKTRVTAVLERARHWNVPVRIGVNAGSLPKDILQKHGHPTPEAMVEAAERELEIFDEHNFADVIVSMKSSEPALTAEANMLFAKKHNTPLHLGVTESGFGAQGLICSTVGLVRMLDSGIGDTIRVSLTEAPENEVVAGREILRFAGLRDYRARVISCPTCGRTEVSLFALAREVEAALRHTNFNGTVAVMGCVVNGPGEAREADFGVACGNGCGLVFRNGTVLRKVSEDIIVEALMNEIAAHQSENC